MTPSCLSLAAALLLASLPITGTAQAVVPAPSTAASAPAPAKPGRRLLTPAEQRDSATPPGELRPERQVVPQIRIPLGKTPPPPETAAAPRKAAASAGAGAGSVARCKSLASASERSDCLAGLKRQNGKR